MSNENDLQATGKETTNGQIETTARAKSGPPLILKLILAQLVNEKGEESFDEVVKELRDHQLLQNIKERIMTEEVSFIYLYIIIFIFFLY